MIRILVSRLGHLAEPNGISRRSVVGPGLTISGTRLVPGAVPSLRKAPYVGSLTKMLHRVADHAYQSDRRGHWWVPAGVDDPIQLLCGQAVQITHGQFMNRAVVGGQQVPTRPNSRHLLWTVPITGSPGAKGELKPVTPRRPCLLDLRKIGDMIILNSAEVPDQPGNRVRGRIGPVAGDVVTQTVGEIDHQLTYPAE